MPPSAGRTWLRFTTVLVLLSVPFWLAGALPLPGLGANLPISAAMAVCPALVVALLARRGGPDRDWWHRGLVVVRGPGRRLVAVAGYSLTMPLVVLAAAGAGGAPPADLVDPRSWLPALPLVVPLLIAAMAEEVGWTGWLLPRLTGVGRPWRAALVVGATWGLWHAVPYLQAGNPLSWVLGQVLFSVVFRLLIVAVTGVVGAPLLGAVLLHATYNIAWQAVLHSGGAYSPWTTALATGVTLGVLLLLTRGRRRAG